jgi:GT2 family glycosyltransferase
VTGLRFSVIITTYNRPASLARTLAVLARTDYPHNEFEVIVVDDGGSEPLEGIVAGFSTEMNVRLIQQSNGGPAKGRNKGADVARNEFLAFTDDDCQPAPGWLSALARRLQRSPECLVGGRTVNGLTENPYSTASQLIIEMVYAFYNADPEQAQFFATNNLAVRADLFRVSGSFDENFRVSEDREFCNRWRQRGFRMSYEPEAIVEHHHPLTFAGFWRQHFSYGRGAANFHHTCAARSSGRLRDHFGFYRRLPRSWRQAKQSVPRRQLATMVPLLALWQIANAAGFCYELVS